MNEEAVALLYLSETLSIERGRLGHLQNRRGGIRRAGSPTQGSAAPARRAGVQRAGFNLGEAGRPPARFVVYRPLLASRAGFILAPMCLWFWPVAIDMRFNLLRC